MTVMVTGVSDVRGPGTCPESVAETWTVYVIPAVTSESTMTFPATSTVIGPLVTLYVNTLLPGASMDTSVLLCVCVCVCVCVFC